MLSSDVYNELERTNLSFREDLQSEKFYASLYKLGDLTGYIDDCSSLGNLPSGASIKRICARVLKYLETVYKKLYKKDDPYDVCLLLNYWVYSKLFDILQYKGERFVHQAYGKLQLIWSIFLHDKSYHNLCEPIDEMVSHHDWRKRKELYEYYVDYYPIKQSLGYYTKRCDEFHQYIENKKTLYEHFKKRCPSDDTKICPDFYKRCEQYDPDKVLSHLSCHNEIIKERKAAASRVQIGSGLPNGETESRGTSDSMVSDGDPNSNGNPHNERNIILDTILRNGFNTKELITSI
ncbi:hypothetical protein PVIIG_06167 [Plasmodium vivax India VII]|uniref:PIR Superfamily Protein n=1 Tax=Plasmodium vivax India VII TaxID=1077284 RepID=A0A0J9SKF5_PLAVI|nr:hypothetical protein PVIIG_06167 [Plasmodium vivax India VII]